MKEKDSIKKFKRMMSTMEKEMAKFIREIKKVQKEFAKSKDEESRERCIERIHELRESIRLYEQVLNDLNYAMVSSYNSRYTEHLIRKAGMNSREEYLEQKANGTQPDLATIVDIISNKMTNIRNIYMLGSDGTIKRDYDALWKMDQTNSKEFDTLNGYTHFGAYNEYGMQFDDDWNKKDNWFNQDQVIADNIEAFENRGRIR